MGTALQTLFGFFVIALSIIGYWLPSVIAHKRKRQERLATSMSAVVVVNGLLGWTVVGWVVALVMALHERQQWRVGE